MNIIRLPLTRLKSNCYILYHDGFDSVVVIDPGGGADKINAALSGRGLRAESVLLTHGHFDHAGAAAALRRGGAKVYAHALDARMLTSPDSAAYFGAAFDAFTPDVLLSGGEKLRLSGVTAEVIRTPGHTPGGVCYLIGGELFTGDTLFKGDVGATHFPGGDGEALVNSLKRLFALPQDYSVRPGHGAATRLYAEKERLAL